MNMQLSPSDLRPLVEAVVAEVVSQLQASEAMLGRDRLAYTEPEAAKLLGVRSHVMRDARLRGEIVATRVGGRIAYERSELLAYLARERR